MLLGALPWRLRAQRLVDPPADADPVAVVERLGAVQSQLLDQAWWGVGRRAPGLTRAGAIRALDEGRLVRTHVLRPTWHLVAPADLLWMLALTAPRIRRQLASTNRSIGLSEEAAESGAQLVADTLADGRARTRSELAEVLAADGRPSTGTALAHQVMTAELAGLIASGPMRGGTITYLPAAARLPAPPPEPAPRDELLARIARRYAAGHGPFEPEDLAWWASLTVKDARRAVALAELRPTELAGREMWSDAPPEPAPVPPALLLPNFDELISYRRVPEDFAATGLPPDRAMRLAGLLFTAGRLTGGWSRTTTAAGAVAELGPMPPAPPGGSVHRALARELERFTQFWQPDAELL